jgi:hypothetical protein
LHTLSLPHPALAMTARQGLATARNGMAESGLGCLLMPCYSHRFPLSCPNSRSLAKLVSKRLDIESLSSKTRRCSPASLQHSVLMEKTAGDASSLSPLFLSAMLVLASLLWRRLLPESTSSTTLASPQLTETRLIVQQGYSSGERIPRKRLDPLARRH